MRFIRAEQALHKRQIWENVNHYNALTHFFWVVCEKLSTPCRFAHKLPHDRFAKWGAGAKSAAKF